MKCLICKTDEADYSLVNIKANYPCFCANCFWSEAVQYDTFVEVLEAHLKGLDTPQAMSTLKFPTDAQYPKCYNWFAYDEDGDAWFYRDRPALAGEEWYVNSSTKAHEFCVNHSVNNWYLTLRQKGQTLMEKPDYYTWIPGIECKQVTNHFNFNVGNIIKYAWRVGNPQATKHQSTEGLVEDLNKIKMYAEFEIQRLTDETNSRN